jgi:hypothetical protein
MPVTREDLVLVLADGADGGKYPFDPVRLMKACFVTSMAGREVWRPLFRFRAYDYGPFDAGVYAARDSLIAHGMLDATHEGRYDSYVVTETGRARVAQLEADGELQADELAWLRRVGGWVSSKSFSKLLDEIYARWPEYATNSVRW